MFIQMKRFTVTEGNGHLIVEKFSKKGGLLSAQPGFIDKKVLVKKVRRGEEEVILMITWNSEEDWKNWEKSPEHIAGHKAKLGQPKEKPEYVISVDAGLYYVQ